MIKKEGSKVTYKQREGVVVNPHLRLSDTQIRLIDQVSRELLENPGLICDNKTVIDIFKDAGSKVEETGDYFRIRIPSAIIDRALKSAPSTVVLGATNPNNRLVLDALEPRVRFGSGSETNIWLDVDFDGALPKFTRLNGSIERLCTASHLCENLENLDFFIRCVNIQDKEITDGNKDVNKFLASLNNITKHVQAGLTDINAIDDVIQIGEIIAGGKDALRENPVLSFITCVIKSPLQFISDSALKLIEMSRRQIPVVISSSPIGGVTAPFDEFGMVAQINAELLAGVVLGQLSSPGSPLLYGSVPVRSRLDNLNDMYGVPEFNHYNIDCAQMARFYGLPCYSTAGVADTNIPGIQATVEKMITLMSVPWSGAQYIHYAFGLLERTNTFCPEQAVLDDAHIGIIKRIFGEPEISNEQQEKVLGMVREVMNTPHKTYIYNLPMPSKEDVYIRYPLENDEGGALLAAHNRFKEIMDIPRKHLPQETQKEIKSRVGGIVDKTLKL